MFDFGMYKKWNPMKDEMKEARYHAGYGNVVINESLWKKLPDLQPPSIPTNFKEIQRQPMTARNPYLYRYMPYEHMKAWQQRFPTRIVSNKYSQKFNAFSF